MMHKLPDLPFEKSKLSPYMSAETLDYHYGKHHKAYVNKLNELIKGTEYENMSLHDIALKSAGPIYNNAAQAWNHEFFWKCLTPRSEGKASGTLLQAINRDFGSFEQFQEKFVSAAVAHFASGWSWLVKIPDGRLAIRTTPNADRPFAFGETPLFVCDLWEHAYYIDYRNDRGKFVRSVWSIVNWDYVQANFEITEKMAA